jgi:exodeoxyribonuclease V gamma subunit
MLYWISQQFADTSSSAGFISGGITFATLVPMRSIPFKVVCLLGMNDREYPRDNRSLSFDLMTTTKSRKGDRSRRADDRYLFLEAMLSASEILYISYEGRSLKDNQIRPPSVVVSELLDYVSQVFETVEVIEHPLQPFSRRYFTGTALTSFQDHWYRALLEPSHDDAFVDVELPAIEDNNLESIQQLTSFFQHSGKYFLQQRLGVYFGSDEATLQDTESFSLDNLQRYQLSDSALNALIRGQDINDWQEEMRASGFVMQGPIGESYMNSELQHAHTVYSELKDYLDEATDNYQGTITISGDKLQGHLGHRAGDFILNYRSGTLRQRHMIENWINHLFASAAGLNVTSISVSRGKNKAEVNRFKAIPREQAIKHLEQMVSLYYAGLKSPLFLPPETTFGFVKSMTATEDVELAKEAALKIYSGGEFSESSDLYWTRLFDVTTMMDNNFAEQAGLIYGPLLICWQEM